MGPIQHRTKRAVPASGLGCISNNAPFVQSLNDRLRHGSNMSGEFNWLYNSIALVNLCEIHNLRLNCCFLFSAWNVGKLQVIRTCPVGLYLGQFQNPTAIRDLLSSARSIVEQVALWKLETRHWCFATVAVWFYPNQLVTPCQRYKFPPRGNYWIIYMSKSMVAVCPGNKWTLEIKFSWSVLVNCDAVVSFLD